MPIAAPPSLFLITSKLVADFVSGHEVLYLGPFSLPEDRNLIADCRRGDIMENPWNDRNRFQQAAFHTYDLYQ